jgi:2-phospho-L-lactate guanylyltransferase
MRIVAIVPIKPLARGKQRLRSALDVDMRQRLIGTMLSSVLDALGGAQGIDQIGVLTSDRTLVPRGFSHFRDHGDGLNAELELTARTLGADALLIVPADLPYLKSADIVELLGKGQSGRMVLVPDLRRTGTNALFLAPPTLLCPRFGPGSCFAHRCAAGLVRAELLIHESPNIGMDIDLPCDVAMLKEQRLLQYGFLDRDAKAHCA